MSVSTSRHPLCHADSRGLAIARVAGGRSKWWTTYTHALNFRHHEREGSRRRRKVVVSRPGSLQAVRNASSCLAAQGVDTREPCVLVAVASKRRQRRQSLFGVEDSLRELGQLAETAGCRVVGSVTQQLEDFDPRTYLGSGKLAELANAIPALGAETVIFDDELTPSQLRNLSRRLGEEVRLADRASLILDIFSQRAATHEGKLQVALAQAQYQLPRLTRMWTHLERQSGGGQVRGMGEKQMEVDKRLLRTRMVQLESEIEQVRVHRQAYRRRRSETPIPVAALVGYTNAGKSTLLNALTRAETLAEDKLFATLDPLTRRVELPNGQELLLTDTVGFIQKLPTQLVAAFRATLEEIKEATVILHVVDASQPERAVAQADTVETILDDLDVKDIPRLRVWNKMDMCPDPKLLSSLAERAENSVFVSALRAQGLDDLLGAIVNVLKGSMLTVELLIPYDKGNVLDLVHRTGSVQASTFVGSGVLLKACIPVSVAGALNKYVVEEQESSSQTETGAIPKLLRALEGS